MLGLGVVGAPAAAAAAAAAPPEVVEEEAEILNRPGLLGGGFVVGG